MSTTGNPQPYTVRQLEKAVGSLAPAERRVAQYLVDNAGQVVRQSVTDVAVTTGTSAATVLRVCKKLGCAGYREFKLRLVRDLASFRPDGLQEVDPRDSTRVTATKVFSSAIASLTETMSVVEGPLLLEAARLVEAAEEVVVFGVGTSAYVAFDTVRRLRRAGVRATAESSGTDQATCAALLGPRSTVIAISTSGTSADVIEAVTIARSYGAAVIVVTHAPQSPLARLADTVLPVAAVETAFGTEAMAARIAMLVLLDALFVVLALRRQELTLKNIERVQTALAKRQLRSEAMPRERYKDEPPSYEAPRQGSRGEALSP